MPDIPAEVLYAVDAALDTLPQPDSRFERDRWRIVSRVAVDAAAPVLAEAVAGEILAHMEANGPSGAAPASSLLRSAWRRHFGIAARVAAWAFTTEDEKKRLAIDAIAREDFIACAIPEPGEDDQP